MGLLDDAIREHLDLKRRHGADPAEVERAEREALGPVRRAPESDADEPELMDEPGSAPYGADPATFDPEMAPEPQPEAYDLEPAFEGEPIFQGEPGFEDESGFEPEPEAVGPEPAAPESGRPVYEPEPAPPEPPPATLDEAGDWSYDDETPRDDAPRDEGPRTTPLPHPAEGQFGGETAEYDVEAALSEESARQGSGENDDVLEETPEFLQDTPDHDRLWFEQRPPKDFDFDG